MCAAPEPPPLEASKPHGIGDVNPTQRLLSVARSDGGLSVARKVSELGILDQ